MYAETVVERKKRKAEVIEQKTKYLIEEKGFAADQVDLHIDKTIMADDAGSNSEVAWSVVFTMVSLLMIWLIFGSLCTGLLVIAVVLLFVWLNFNDRKDANKTKAE